VKNRNPYLALVPLDGHRVLARGASGLLVLGGVPPEVLRALVERGAGSAGPGSPEAKVLEQLGKITRETPREPPRVRACVLGDGALAGRAANALESMGVTGVERASGALDADGLRALFRDVDHVVCCLEGAPFASLLAVNATALESPRATCHFLFLDAGELAFGPSVPDGCLMCNLLRRVPPPAAPDFARAAPSFVTQTFDRTPEQELAVAVGLADLVRLAAGWAREGEPRLPGTGPGPGRGREDATRVVGCPACKRAREVAATWGTWRPTAAKPPRFAPTTSTADMQRKAAFAIAELELRGAARVWHAAHSFRDHLVGTHDILTGWQLDPGVCLAGLMHSAYSTEQARLPLFALSARGLVRQLVGEHAEELAFLFGTIDRARFESEVAAAPEGWTELRVHNRYTGEPINLPSPIVAALALIEAANIAEQSNDGALGPIVWVGRATSLLRKAAPALGLPLASELVAVLRGDDEKKAIAAYQEARAPGDLAERFARATEAAALNPCVGEPAIVAGLLAWELGRRDEARAWTERGAHALIAWGTPWDKRASLHRWLGACETART
jgi:hypothetical protein